MKPHNPWTPEETARFLVASAAKRTELEARVQLLAKALRSIAANSCCDGCQEAKKVAAHALVEAEIEE